VGLEIHHDAAREERLHVLDAELLQAVGAVHVGALAVAVEQRALGVVVDADMAEAIELGADLADLSGQEVVVPDGLVRSDRSAGEPAGGAYREDPAAEQRHLGLVGPRQRVGLAFCDELGGLQRLFRRLRVGRACLVLSAPFRDPRSLRLSVRNAEEQRRRGEQP
jgi:hypothetical protein